MLPLEPALAIPNSQVPVPSGKMASWLRGTVIVMPGKTKLIVAVLDPAEQGMSADPGELGSAVAPTKFQIEVTRASGS
jgi:hypothetical protein